MAYTNQDIMEALIRLESRVGRIDGTLTEVKEQTTKTNGRVTKIEEWKNALEAVDQYKKDNPAPQQNIKAETVVFQSKLLSNPQVIAAIAALVLAFAGWIQYLAGQPK